MVSLMPSSEHGPANLFLIIHDICDLEFLWNYSISANTSLWLLVVSFFPALCVWLYVSFDQFGNIHFYTELLKVNF